MQKKNYFFSYAPELNLNPSLFIPKSYPSTKSNSKSKWISKYGRALIVRSNLDRAMSGLPEVLKDFLPKLPKMNYIHIYVGTRVI